MRGPSTSSFSQPVKKRATLRPTIELAHRRVPYLLARTRFSVSPIPSKYGASRCFGFPTRPCTHPICSGSVVVTCFASLPTLACGGSRSADSASLAPPNRSAAHATSDFCHSSIYRRANEASHSPRAQSYHTAAKCVRESLNKMLTGSL